MKVGLSGAVLAAVLVLPQYAPPDEPPPIDGARLAAGLREDPVQLLPGSPARLDVARLRAEIEAAEPRVPGRIVLVAAPFAYSELDIEKALAGHLAPEDQLIAIAGLRVTIPDWVGFAGGGYADQTFRHLRDEINVRHRDAVLITHDVTGPVTDLLRLIRHEPLTTPVPVSPVPADPAVVELVLSRLRAGNVYVDPVVDTDQHLARWDPYFARTRNDPTNYRIAYLPAIDPGQGRPDLLTPLAKAFPGDVVVVVAGGSVRVAGPGDQADFPEALRFAVDSTYDQVLMWHWTHRPVKELFVRLVQLRDGTLDPRAIPVRPEDVSTTGAVFGSWAFAGTAVAIVGTSAGAWWWLRVRRRRVEAKAIRLGNAETAAELAQLASLIGALPAGPGEDRATRDAATAAQRYATAVDLMEQATTPGELATAREVISEGIRLLDKDAR